MSNDEIKKAFDNLKASAKNGNAGKDAFKDLFDEAIEILAKSSLSNEEKIALVMDMRKFFNGLITAGEVHHDMIMRLRSGIQSSKNP